MKRIFVLIPRENWIVDRIGSEFCSRSIHDSRISPFDCDIIWLAAPWCWRQINWQILNSKKVVCSIHHEVPSKFFGNKLSDFLERDEVVDQYIVPCKQTFDFISQFTDKPITQIGYWWNKEIWFPSNENEVFDYRKRIGISDDEYVIGSFQRDTEGSDLKTPKLEKGPDIFCNYVKMLSDLKEKKLHILLGGWRRQYVINRLSKYNIRFTYCELPPQSEIRKMYSACDLYVSTSRFEGGPQCLFESVAVGTNIVSSNVGMATDCLTKDFIVEDFLCENSFKSFTENNNNDNIEKIRQFELSVHIGNYDKFFEVL